MAQHTTHIKAYSSFRKNKAGLWNVYLFTSDHSCIYVNKTSYSVYRDEILINSDNAITVPEKYMDVTNDQVFFSLSLSLPRHREEKIRQVNMNV